MCAAARAGAGGVPRRAEGRGLRAEEGRGAGPAAEETAGRAR